MSFVSDPLPVDGKGVDVCEGDPLPEALLHLVGALRVQPPDLRLHLLALLLQAQEDLTVLPESKLCYGQS